ncbi:unnamed protein product [Mytilus coruscus]|uniref:Uncharacterized protein n=1 Tax=Mytilus coruscus TaxID=42192 RepID=A0A6J8B9F9_MYTCO|nr:unnamed protein product [Mytilus coruscus]
MWYALRDYLTGNEVLRGCGMGLEIVGGKWVRIDNSTSAHIKINGTDDGRYSIYFTKRSRLRYGSKLVIRNTQASDSWNYKVPCQSVCVVRTVTGTFIGVPLKTVVPLLAVLIIVIIAIATMGTLSVKRGIGSNCKNDSVPRPVPPTGKRIK